MELAGLSYNRINQSFPNGERRVDLGTALLHSQGEKMIMIVVGAATVGGWYLVGLAACPKPKMAG